MYRRRWEVEKVFDEIKNKLGEKKEKLAADLATKARRAGRVASSLVVGVRRASQHSVKFIRWLRHALRENLTEALAVPRRRCSDLSRNYSLATDQTRMKHRQRSPFVRFFAVRTTHRTVCLPWDQLS